MTQNAEALRESKINNYSARICAAWNRAVESIFAVGDLIVEAKKELSDEEHDALLNRLPFGPRAAQMLEKLASDPRLRKKRIQKLLPPHWGTLVELNRLTPKEFEIAKKKNLITPEVTREDVISFRKQLRGNGSEAKTTNTIPAKEILNESSHSTLIFEIPEGLNNVKTLLDLRFLYYLASTLFNNSDGKNKLNVAPFNLPAEALDSYKVYCQLMEQAHKLENHSREKKGKKPLNEIQKMLSLLGGDPDKLGEHGFCLMERISLAYAKRQGLDCVKEKDLKWFAAKPGTKPKLLGSFLHDVAEYVESITG